YGTEAKKYFDFHPVLEKINIGGSVKLFNQTLTGLPTREVYATGIDFDLGAQYQHNSWLRFGMALYNILPYQYGGRLVWGSGLTESIPAYAKIGTAVKIIGEGGLRQEKFAETDLTITYDAELPIGKVRPVLHHFGAEWSPWKPLAIRLGIDQDVSAADPASNTVDNNLTAGIGLSVFNVRFDYAYHTFGSLPENITHFVSITYGMGEVGVPTFTPGLGYLEIEEPQDKFITFSPYVIVKGKLLKPKDVSQIKVNQTAADLYPDNTFFSLMKLPEYGINFLDVKAMSVTGRIIENRRLNAAYLVTFRDIGKDHPLRNILGGLGALGYVSGYNDQTFRPDAGITRAELCALLMKIRPGIEVEAHPKSMFKDVPTTHWAFRYISQAAKQNLVEGYPDGMFRLNNAITRAETTSILVRFAGLKPPVTIGRRPYPDVAPDFWAAKIIQVAKENDFFKNLNWRNFDPDQRITRGEVVTILAEVGSIKEKLDELIK
ncbi:MAG: S-layer homology domain-containing protein, partial [Candidatus Margulisbacteria bacterium]|nr:S-layer homology domain-containing protein [Candidatus Margulisiibacteriota bacterium]